MRSDEMWIGVDGYGKGDGDGVNSRAVFAVFENFFACLCLIAYLWPVVRSKVVEVLDSISDKSSSSLSSSS